MNSLALIFTVLTASFMVATSDFIGEPYGVPQGPTFITGTATTTNAGFRTVTSTITRTHTIRKTSTTDVRLTSAVIVPLTVTQYATRREFVRDNPDTVTSFVRVTMTPIVVETTTVEKYPVRTIVSRVTDFHTVKSTVDLWHPVTHYKTSFEIVRLPVEETQTLLQVLYDTVTVTSRVVVTTTHGNLGYGQYAY